MKIDLSKMSQDELAALQGKIAAELEIRKQKEKEEVIQQIHDIARRSGFSLDELVGTGKKSTQRRTKGEVKYRDPADPRKNWTGRGRKPKWLEAELAAGKNLDDFAV